MIRLHLALLLFAASPAWAQTAATAPAQIVLIRHAEKPADPADPHLSKAGVRRAERLVAFITSDAAVGRFGSPVALFATETTNDGNGLRTQETLAPLARALKLPVLTPYHGSTPGKLAKLILSSPAYAGKTVVVCWNHETIPQLAAALGIRPLPPKWKGKTFDRVYLITYQGGRASLAKLRYQ